jgi:hypothetical protein
MTTGSFTGCESAGEMEIRHENLGPMQLLLTAVEHHDQAHLDNFSLGVGQADSDLSQPLMTDEPLIYNIALDTDYDAWEFLFDDSGDPFGTVGTVV